MTAITSKTFTHGPSLSIPRGARAAADVFVAAGRLLAFLFTPATPRRSTDAEDIALVRALARRYEKTEPGMASDLYAAAVRHEAKLDR